MKKNIKIIEFQIKLAVHLTSCRKEDIPSGSITTTSKKRHKLQLKLSELKSICNCTGVKIL